MPIEPRQPEQKLNSELKDQDLSVSPDIGNTHVVGSQIGTSIESVTKEISSTFLEFKSVIDKYPNAIGLTYEPDNGYIVDVNYGIIELLQEVQV